MAAETKTESPDTLVDVVIIGAGMAGLTAAHALIDEHHVTNVVLLEANSVPGGRISPRPGILKDKDVEVGAEFLHGDETIYYKLVSENGWGLWHLFTWSQGDGGPSEEPAHDGGIGYYYYGKSKRLFRFDECPKDLNDLHELLWSMESLPHEATSKDKRTMEQWFRDCGVEGEALSMADAGFANTTGASMQDTGIAQSASSARMWSRDGGHDFRFWPSSRPMLEHLAKGLDIRCNWRVASVNAFGSGGPVRLSSYDGRSMLARRVICTVSVEILRDGDISFVPPLRPTATAAINRIRLENGIKILCIFDTRCWPENFHGAICADSFVPEFWMNKSMDGTQLLISGFAMSKRADAIVALPQATAVARFVAQLDEIFGSRGYPMPSQHLVSGFVASWKNEPYVRGAYVAPMLKMPEWAKGEYAKPHAHCVFFAGEGVSGGDEATGSPAVIHGAMKTGLQAAEAVAASLQRESTSRL